MNSVIIPCYFLDESYITMTEKCVQSLKDTTDDLEIIIIDDGSPISPKPIDGTKYFGRTINGGYTSAVNLGLYRATGDVLIIANNDITFLPGWYEALMKPIEMGYDISTIRTTDCDGWETEDKITDDDKFGSLFAMKREVYDLLGGFSKRFRGYFADLDYRRRALNAGLKIGKNHNGLVEHIGKKTYSESDPADNEFLEMRDKYMKVWGFIE